MSGGAADAGIVMRGCGLSEPLVRLETSDVVVGICEKAGLRASVAGGGAEAVGTGAVAGAGDCVDVSGADSEFLTLEIREVTSAYEEVSFSSSSENGLNDVRLVTSSLTLALPQDRDDWPLRDPSAGDVAVVCMFIS